MGGVLGTLAPSKIKGFTNWFGKSKVIDKNKEPLVLYHGTTKTFDKFKRPSEIKDLERGGIVRTDGIFFSESPYIANVYARRLGRDKIYKEGAQVKPVYLKIEKPYVIDENSISNKLRKTIAEMRGKYYTGDSNKIANKEQIDNLIKKGYDGIIIKRKPNILDEPQNEYIVFNNNQIISATAGK